MSQLDALPPLTEYMDLTAEDEERRPVGIVHSDSPQTGPHVIVLRSDGAVFLGGVFYKEWSEAAPIPGTRRARELSEERDGES